ncbi:MAG: hypothetical protein FWH11_11350 [Micrococcales bacterium]|nr:hypothetical protein [Micrococcales bacterium]
MSDALFSTVELGAPTGPGPGPGYRLQHLEVYQWGTFDQRVWRLVPDGQTTLLTGDIGSGKSTLVDALTTLLLPAHRISYNKAAGAETRERTLRSYVEGHYKTEQVESTGTLRPIGLRDHTSYSVLCGVFVNTGYDQTVSLAQVFHQNDRAGQPDRFFVTADRALSVAEDFTGFGSALKDLKARLRASGAGIYTTFPEYGRALRRMLGIRSEQAMELFHQTVSMKSVGNLNEFVRKHMLEPADADEQVRGIVAHFDDLTAAHDAVRRAREQLEVLGPLVETSDRYDAALARRSAAEQQRDAVNLFTTELRVRLLDAVIAENAAALEQVKADIDQDKARQQVLDLARESLIAERAGAGGDRIAALEREADQARTQVVQRRRTRERFDALVAEAALPEVVDPAGFAALPAAVASHKVEVTARRVDLDEQIQRQVVDRAGLRTDRTDTADELDSLNRRTSNLPAHQLDLRAQLCAHLGVEPESLPFAGELLDVADDQAQWRGAAERVLRGFALSLLVSDEHYPQVAAWVNDRRLTHRRADGTQAGSRLVYERVSARRVRVRLAEADGLRLADCLQVREGPFADYLRDELVRRADHRCVTTMAQFREQNRAVTVEGQVKSAERHVKDDRTRVDDPRTWVLGWVNERKVDALTRHLNTLDAELGELKARLDGLNQERSAVRDTETALARLADYTLWSDLDWAEAEDRAARADAERERLLAGSSRLAEIDARLTENKQQTDALGDRLAGLARDVGRLDDRLARDAQARTVAAAFVAAYRDPDTARASFPQLRERLGAEVPASPEECDTAAQRLGTALQGTIDKAARELNRHTQTMLAAMHTVRDRWPEATTEMDVDVDARDEYCQLHRRVADDDLPRFESEFKRQLNTNAIRELAAFNNWLRRQADEIQNRVDRINEALGALDYSPGRYITLLRVRTDNKEVHDFRSDLRRVTDDTLAPDDGDQYSEQRFADVRRIIERFRGRVNHTEADKAWTRRVTDVRNWFVFSASERDRTTDVEWEHYRDSDGKSGGQKEKLAYTILAASLAYQFGLEWGATRSKDFRFAVIDEAFGRGSDASTRYALELFAKIGLQLLIVTPLQKVHVIEPYVKAIGFVDNLDGSSSRLQTLTIEEYHTLRDGRAEPTGPEV